MIASRVKGNIFDTPHKHIAFAVNTEGYNDSGFVGQVSSRYWPQLVNIGKKKLGEVLYHRSGDKTFHALVCHSPRESGGWTKTPEMITKCLDSLDVPDDQVIAILLIGSGLAGQMGGADSSAILRGMEQSKKKVVVYAL